MPSANGGARAIPSRHWPAIMAATGLSMEELNCTSCRRGNAAGRHRRLVLGDGSVFWGRGFGAHGTSLAAELCFSTGMTGYQETLTDPSFAGQIITFTFPHIGNVGTNAEDFEAANIFRPRPRHKEDITAALELPLDRAAEDWLKKMGIPGIAGIDTRTLTLRIRDLGAPNAVSGLSRGWQIRSRRPGADRRRLARARRAWIWPRGLLHAIL